MQKVLSTYSVLMKKAFNEDIEESWVDWAFEMIKAGYESEYLYILAGITKPYNLFELQALEFKPSDFLAKVTKSIINKFKDLDGKNHEQSDF